MSFLDKIRPYKSIDLTRFVRVLIDGQGIGWTKPDFANVLSDFNDTWVLNEDGLHLNAALTTYQERTNAIDETFTAMGEQGLMPNLPDYTKLGGIDWFPIYGPDRSHLAIIKRFFAPFLGVYWESVIVNGYHGAMYWSPRRGPLVEASPGKMDALVAGSILHDQTKEEALYDEGHCEAGITEEWSDSLELVRDFQLYYPNKGGFLAHERFYIYDFDTKGVFQPKTNLPGEVEGIFEYEMSHVMAMVQDGDVFKPQINIVVTDFLIRHGYITPDHPEYAEIVALLAEERDFRK